MYEDGKVKLDSSSDWSDIYDIIGHNFVDKNTDTDNVYLRQKPSSVLGAEGMHDISMQKRKRCIGLTNPILLRECLKNKG